MNVSKKLIGLIFLFLFAVCGVFLIFIIVVIVLKRENNDQKYIHYRTEYNPSHNETVKSYALINRKLGNEEYISYKDMNTGKTHMIHSFLGKEYECSGYCRCNDDNVDLPRRGLLPRPKFETPKSKFVKLVVFIVTAVTFGVAMKWAYDVGVEQCRELYYHYCPSDIDYVVEKCKLKEDEVPERGILKKTYICFGYCVPIEEYVDNPIVSKIIQDFNCAENERLGEVELTNEPFSADQAIDLFREQSVIPYCAKISKQKFKIPETNEEGVERMKRKKVSICMGTSATIGAPEGENNNVDCLEAFDNFKSSEEEFDEQIDEQIDDEE